MVRKAILIIGFIGLLIALSNATEAGPVKVNYEAASEDGKNKPNVVPVLKKTGVWGPLKTDWLAPSSSSREDEEKVSTCPENLKMLCKDEDDQERWACVDGKEFKKPNEQVNADLNNPASVSLFGKSFSFYQLECKEAKHKIKPELFEFFANLESDFTNLLPEQVKTTPVYCKTKIASQHTSPIYYKPKDGADQAALIKRLKNIQFKNQTINDSVKYEFIVCEGVLTKWEKYGKWIILIVVVLIIGGVMYWFLFCDEDDDDEGNYSEDEEKAPSS